MVLNHCALVKRDGASVLLRDTLSNENFRIRPRIVVNATGAWADHANRLLGSSLNS